MKLFFRILCAALILSATTACKEKDGKGNTNDSTDVNTGATTQEENMVKGRIGNGTFVTFDNQTISAYGIDFNKDGQLEFCISDDRTAITYIYSEDGNNVVNAESQWDIIDPLEKRHAIHSGCRWEGQGDAVLPELNTLPEKFYVGFRFMLDSVKHYGWAKVKYKDGELEWDKCAYNVLPSKTAFAGED